MAGAIGNALDWYGLRRLRLLRRQYSPVSCFPSSNYLTSPVAAFQRFGGFWCGRSAAILIGHVGDIYGRRPALSIGVLMAVPTTMIAFLPTAQVGVHFRLLTLMRALRVGGVWRRIRRLDGLPVRTRARDSACPPHKDDDRIVGRILLGSATGAAMSLLLSDSELFAWGWRVPFLGGVVLGLAGWYVRRQVQDDPQQSKTGGRTSSGR
ncbi:MAG: hypothetical protein R3D30_07925 [Hyphomicrobiales bacterium]